MIDSERVKHLKAQWEKRTDSQRDDLLCWLLKHCWATPQAQDQ